MTWAVQWLIFLCQLNQVKLHRDSWQNIISGYADGGDVSRGHWHLNQSKNRHILTLWEVALNPLRCNQKAEGGFNLSLYSSETSIFSCHWTLTSLSLGFRAYSKPSPAFGASRLHVVGPRTSLPAESCFMFHLSTCICIDLYTYSSACLVLFLQRTLVQMYI